MDKYNGRGVSSKKEDVHSALKNIDNGLYPGAFCKIIPDYLGNDEKYCNIMHSDGAGTKSSLAYIYYKETGDLSVFKGIAMDSIVMNIDDLLCSGATDNFLLSSSIGRNSNFIDGKIIKSLIEANQEIARWYTDNGINVILCGGETADLGDIVRTLVVDTTVTARLKRNDVIDNSKIKAGQVIVGLASFGKANFEEEYNGGIGSNGLTSARHDLFNKIYKEKYPESFNPLIKNELVYAGKYLVTDIDKRLPINIGKAALSPTRTYAFIIKEILNRYRDAIGGIVHCSGGGQAKCLRFGNKVNYIKDNLFEPPPLFQIIKESSQSSDREMYTVFNMGHRMEIYTDEKTADEAIKISKSYGVDAKIIGRIEESDNNKVTLKINNQIIEYVL